VISVKHTVRKDGSHTIKIGRAAYVLRTRGEADAFLAGVKIAHVNLTAKILPILQVKDGRDDLQTEYQS
jgi:uncharacterized cupin superfamily protein